MTIRLGLTARNYLAALQERRNDHGASMLEYVGVLVVVALIATAIFGVFNDGMTETITSAIQDSINSILGEGGGEEP